MLFIQLVIQDRLLSLRANAGSQSLSLQRHEES